MRIVPEVHFNKVSIVSIQSSGDAAQHSTIRTTTTTASATTINSYNTQQ